MTKELNANTGVKLTVGQSVVVGLHLITLVGGIMWGTWLAADFRSQNDEQHRALISITEKLLRQSWTVTDMKTLYANPSFLFNHTNASYSDRMVLIQRIHDSNDQN
jgi:hypothetical protein